MTAETTVPRRSANPTPEQRAAANDWLQHALTRPTGCSVRVLARMRSWLGLTQADVAAHIPSRRPYGRSGEERTVRQPTLAAIESGEIGMPRGFFRLYVKALDAAVRTKRETDRIEAVGRGVAMLQGDAA